VQDTNETLRHEALAHFGINLLAPGDKIFLLADIIAAKNNSDVGAIYNQIKKDYPRLSLYLGQNVLRKRR
jgi:hypothetical protein